MLYVGFGTGYDLLFGLGIGLVGFFALYTGAYFLGKLVASGGSKCTVWAAIFVNYVNKKQLGNHAVSIGWFVFLFAIVALMSRFGRILKV